MPPLIITHAALAGAAVLLGAVMLARRKGTSSHKWLGRAWVALMAAVALSSFWIFEIRRGAGPSLIHPLSAWTVVSLALTGDFIPRGHLGAHRGFMIGTLAWLILPRAVALAPGP